MTKRDWFAIIFAGLFLFSLTGLPYLIGYLSTPADQVYVGRVPITGADTTAYYSNIMQAKEGRLLFSNQFTAEPQRPTLFHPVWLITGWVAAIFNWSAPVAYQATRLLGVVLFVWLLFSVLAKTLPRRAERWWGILVITTASGLGWLANIDFRQNIDIHTTPVDLWVAESTTFMSISHSLLFIGSQALLLYLLWTYWRWLEHDPTVRLRWLGPGVFLLALIHPYDLVTVVGVGAAWLVYKLIIDAKLLHHLRPIASQFLILLAWVLPAVLYYLLLVFREPAMAGWLKQNVDITSDLWLVGFGWGLLLPLAAYGALRGRQDSSWRIFLMIWFLAGMVMIYLPGLTIQRRLLNGLQIPLAILAVYGALRLSQQWRWRPVQLLWLGVLPIILGLSSWKSLALDIAQVVPNGHANYPVRIHRSEADAMSWLRRHAGPDEPIFSEVWAGNTIAGLAGRTVVLGHGHQTLDLQNRLRDWLAFRQSWLTPSERTALLARLRVHWLFWRKTDQLPDGYQPAQDPRWTLVFHQGSVEVFALQANLPEGDAH